MKFTILTIGSQGDVEPFIALGKCLQNRGHQVKIAALWKFEQEIGIEGFEYAPLAGDAAEVIRLLVGEQGSPFQYFRNLDRLLNPVKEQFLSDVTAACEGADALLYSLLGSVAWHIGDRLGIPCFRCLFCPLDPTGEFPAMTAPALPLGPLYNRFTYLCGDLLWCSKTRRLLNGWRAEMGLAGIPPFRFPYRSLHGHPVTTLYAYSSLIAPKPTDWNENRYLTGYWFREEKTDWTPDPKLADFLASGSKPLYIGFGSMVGGSFQQIPEIVIKSLQITKQRAIFSVGWGGLQNLRLPDFVFPMTGFVPHEWLFPRVATVIHHGGAGTTAAGLRAGVPTVIVPFGIDQPYWGNRVFRLGVGPEPIPRKRLNVQRLSNTISQTINNSEMAQNAHLIGQKLRAEDGVGNAADIIERFSRV